MSKLDESETPLPNGCTLFRAANGVGGHEYISDEIGGGVRVWDTCVVDRTTLLAAIVEESRRERAEYIGDERAGRSKRQLQQLLTNLFIAITPKLGGGGISDAMLARLRDLAIPHLTDEQRRICGVTTTERTTGHGSTSD